MAAIRLTSCKSGLDSVKHWFQITTVIVLHLEQAAEIASVKRFRIDKANVRIPVG